MRHSISTHLEIQVLHRMARCTSRYAAPMLGGWPPDFMEWQLKAAIDLQANKDK